MSGFGKKGEEETETKQRGARRVRGKCETKRGGGQFPSLFLFFVCFWVWWEEDRLSERSAYAEGDVRGNGGVGGACIGQTGLTEAGAGEKI